MLDTDSALNDLICAPFLVAALAFPRTPLLVMPHALDPPCIMSQTARLLTVHVNIRILLATRTLFVSNADNVNQLSVDETLELWLEESVVVLIRNRPE